MSFPWITIPGLKAHRSGKRENAPAYRLQGKRGLVAKTNKGKTGQVRATSHMASGRLLAKTGLHMAKTGPTRVAVTGRAIIVVGLEPGRIK